MTLSPTLRETAQWMLWQLDSCQLRVTLAPGDPARDPNRKVRVVEEENPQWYQEFCAEYPSYRSWPRRRSKPDTAIKRSHTLRALGEMAQGGVSTEYAQRLLPYVEAETQKIYQGELTAV